jgi:hypothetical protein
VRVLVTKSVRSKVHRWAGSGIPTSRSGTVLGPLIPVPGWILLFRYRTGSSYSGSDIGFYFSFRYPNDQMPLNPTFKKAAKLKSNAHVHYCFADGGEGCILHDHIAGVGSFIVIKFKYLHSRLVISEGRRGLVG